VKRLFIILTRIHANKGSTIPPKDEFISDWFQQKDAESILIELPQSDLLLVHGYRVEGLRKFEEVKQFWIERLVNLLKHHEIDTKKYVSAYFLGHYPEEEEVQLSVTDLGRFIKARAVMAGTYSGAEGGLPGGLERLQNEIQDISERDAFREAAQEVIAVSPKIRTSLFHVLRHKIAKTFSPLRYDIQGLMSVAGSTRLEYAREIIEEHKDNPHYYEQKLADLRFLVTGENVRTVSKDEGNEASTIKPSLTEESLPEGKCVWVLIEKASMQESVPAGKLLQLIGLKRDWDSFQPLVGERIEQFLQKLDKGRIDGVAPFMAVFEAGTQEFNKWYQNLHETLNVLQSELDKKGF
jgi:hypothetical protein